MPNNRLLNSHIPLSTAPVMLPELPINLAIHWHVASLQDFSFAMAIQLANSVTFCDSTNSIHLILISVVRELLYICVRGIEGSCKHEQQINTIICKMKEEQTKDKSRTINDHFLSTQVNSTECRKYQFSFSFCMV